MDRPFQQSASHVERPPLSRCRSRSGNTMDIEPRLQTTATKLEKQSTHTHAPWPQATLNVLLPPAPLTSFTSESGTQLRRATESRVEHTFTYGASRRNALCLAQQMWLQAFSSASCLQPMRTRADLQALGIHCSPRGVPPSALVAPHG